MFVKVGSNIFSKGYIADNILYNVYTGGICKWYILYIPHRVRWIDISV